MTATIEHRAPAAAVPAAVTAPAAPASARTGPLSTLRRPLPPTWAYLGSVLAGLAALLLGFTLILTVGSGLQNSRDQQVLYGQFREQLANAVAPVGAVSEDGSLLRAGAPVALLEVPRLGLAAVVVEGTTSAETMTGPGHRRDSVFPGQAGVSIILGRQAAFGGPFGGLGSLTTDDVITTTTGQGTATYTVVGLRRAGDPQPSASASKGRLVLTTADGDPFLPSGVLRVDAELVSTSVDGIEVTPDAFPAGTRLVGPAGLADSERAMGIDTSSVFALVLWSQLFLAAVLALTWARRRWGRWQAWRRDCPSCSCWAGSSPTSCPCCCPT